MSTAIWAERRFCVSRLDRSAEGRESVSALREISQPTSKRRAVPTGDVKRGRRAISQQVKDAQRLAESGQRSRLLLCPCDCCSLRAAARAHKALPTHGQAITAAMLVANGAGARGSTALSLGKLGAAVPVSWSLCKQRICLCRASQEFGLASGRPEAAPRHPRTPSAQALRYSLC